MVITSRAPVRVDFAGAWTDVGIFARGAGGAVVNATIDKYVHGRLEVYETGPGNLAPDEGIRVTYWCDLPSGSGLGTSAALNVCWLSLIQAQVNPDLRQKERIADLAYRLEEILGILGGKQDQYAAAVGGFSYLTFTEEVTVERLQVQPAMLSALEERLVLCYTGKSRLSSNIHEEVWDAFRRGVPETVNALYDLRNCAVRMRTVIKKSDVEEFGELIGQSWRHQKALAPSVTNEQIEQLFDVAGRAGATHGKACGAGGGGCLLFFTARGRKEAVSEALTQQGVRVIPFRFEFDGLEVAMGDRAAE
jgi:D-glycero-alpha-D-manno-heptose-7-phosphate kinase